MQTVLGVDLPWGERAKDRFAWALLSLDGRVLDLQWGRNETQFFNYLAGEASEGLAAVLLDIPIHGLPWALANGQNFRPVDRALQAVGIPLYPLRHYGRQGSALAADVRRAAGREDLLVIEVYPFATLRTLTTAPSPSRGGGWDEGETTQRTPVKNVAAWPRYKRGPRPERRRGLAQVAGLLHASGGLIVDDTLLPIPTEAAPVTAFDRAADACDACLAALPGLYWLRPSASPRACLAGDEEHGQLLLMTHESLVTQLRQRQVPVRFSAQGGPS